MVKILNPYTSRLDEIVRCEIRTVSLDDWRTEFLTWSQGVNADVPRRERIHEWHSYCRKRHDEDKSVRLGRFNWGDYFAISYAWGSPERTHSIILNGCLFKVPKSVTFALRSAHARYKIRGTPSYWLDFLCIDQDDIDDKKHQIMRMKTIFGNSFSVLIHLGERTDDSDLGFDLINTVATKYSEGFDYRSYFNGISRPKAEDQNVLSTVRNACIAACRLFGRPYWKRVWVIQELAMADDLSEVICGDQTTTLHKVRVTMKVLFDNTVHIQDVVGEEGLSDLTKAFETAASILAGITPLRRWIRIWNEQTSLTYLGLRSPLLYLAQGAKATYRYDQVFGLLGMLPESIAGRMRPLLDELPAVAEKMPTNSPRVARETNDAFVKRIFIEFSKAIINATNELDVIFAANTFQKVDSTLFLPSWVTDWTLGADRSQPNDWQDWYFANEMGVYSQHLDLGKQDGPLLLTRARTRPLNMPRADGGRRGKFRFLNEDDALHCEGIPIGSIDGIAPCLPFEMSALERDLEPIVQPLNQHSPYGDETATIDALSRTLFFDAADEIRHKSSIFSFPWWEQDTPGEPIKKAFEYLRDQGGWDPHVFVSMAQYFDTFRRELRDFRVAGKPFKDYFPSDTPVCSPPPERKDFFESFAYCNVFRRLVTTSSGHFSLAPVTVKPSDQIFVILGCSVPVVLRPCGVNDGYEVVGECYVEGFMHGECIKDVDAGSRELQDIVLR